MIATQVGTIRAAIDNIVMHGRRIGLAVLVDRVTVGNPCGLMLVKISQPE